MLTFQYHKQAVGHYYVPGIRPHLTAIFAGTRPVYFVLVAGMGVEPICEGYEPTEWPLFYPAMFLWCSNEDLNPNLMFTGHSC